jgi:hypothetical protein
MWKIYLNSSEGVAVRTTCGILHEQLCQVKPFQGVRAVRYLDFNRKSMGDLWLGQLPLLKRSAFRHENEVRALLCYLDQKSEVLDPMHRGEAERLVDTISGVPVKVDLDRLVRGVVVSPTAPSWFLALVESVAKKFRLSAPVYQSSLASDPLT